MAATSVGHFFFRRQKFQIQMFDAAKAKKNNGRASQRQSDDFYTFFFFIQMKCKEAPHLNNISHAKSQVKREGAKYANHLSDCKKIDWPFSAHLHMTGCGPWRPFVELKKRPFTARWPVKPAALHRVVCTRKWLRERADAASVRVTLDDWPKRKDRPLELVHFGRGPDAIDGRFRCNTRRPFIWASINTSRAVVFRLSFSFIAVPCRRRLNGSSFHSHDKT